MDYLQRATSTKFHAKKAQVTNLATKHCEVIRWRHKPEALHEGLHPSSLQMYLRYERLIGIRSSGSPKQKLQQQRPTDPL